MNPSARGWINKLLKSLSGRSDYVQSDTGDVYLHLRRSGFIYGNNVAIAGDYSKSKGLSQEEMGKVNLVIALNSVYKQANLNQSFSSHLLQFYKAINQYKRTLFDEIIGQPSTITHLERIIHKRVQIDPNMLTRNFNYFVTNALLFVDVLAYMKFISEGSVSETYLKNIEATIEAVSLKSLNSKSKINDHDRNLMDLIESSLRYQNFKQRDYVEAIKVIKFESEKKYLFDIACMTAWTDHLIDPKERDFLENLRIDLGLSEEDMDLAILEVNSFYTTYKNSLNLLNSKNVIKNFYTNSNKMVNQLLSRNSKRLQREIKESKELMNLIGQSTVRDLNEEEQKKLQSQLLDIFKTIPSLAIFLLPGGTLLLPIVIKFIPNLLPSAFDDNRVEK